jgi:hypothetical protein
VRPETWNTSATLPIAVIRSYEIARKNPDVERTRQYLYSHHPINEARALYSRMLVARNDSYQSTVLKENIAVLANTTTSDDFLEQDLQPSPTSTPAEALAVIPATIAPSSHFTNVDLNEFLDQLRERVSEGGHEKTNQGDETNFCWTASITKYAYEKDPKGMAEAMIGLYENGTFVYDNNNGGMNVSEPSEAVKDAVGSNVFDNNQNEDEGKTINELDQMLFMTLADAPEYKGYTNVDLNYDADDEEDPTWSGKVLSQAVEIWKDFGYDVDAMGVDAVGWITNTSKIDIVKDAMEASDAVLFVNSGAFKKGSYVNLFATHYIHVSSIEQISDNDPMTIDEIEIKYWDYGEPRAIRMYPEQFTRSVYGVIQIPKTND